MRVSFMEEGLAAFQLGGDIILFIKVDGEKALLAQ